MEKNKPNVTPSSMKRKVGILYCSSELRNSSLPKTAFKPGSLHVLAIQGSVTEDARAQQSVFTWIWTCWSHQPPPDLGKQQPRSLCSTALIPGQAEGQEKQQLHEGTQPPKWGGKKHFPSQQALAAVSGRPGLFREGRGHSPMCLELAALPPGRCSWRGGAELHAIPQHSPNETLIPQEQRAQPPSCSPAPGFWHKGFELGLCWFH